VKSFGRSSRTKWLLIGEKPQVLFIQGHGRQGFLIHDVMNNPRNCERLIGWEGIGVRLIGVQLEMNSMKSLLVRNKIDISI
jgi:hypothetical protein